MINSNQLIAGVIPHHITGPSHTQREGNYIRRAHQESEFEGHFTILPTIVGKGSYLWKQVLYVSDTLEQKYPKQEWVLLVASSTLSPVKQILLST